MEAQELLGKKGHDVGAQDTKMGPKTWQACMDFQRSNQLECTGNLTPETMSKLREP